MQKYVEQLVEDLRKATWNTRPPHEIWADSEADPDDEIELEDISFVEEFVYGQAEKISEITGIETFLLPPPEKLTNGQKATLATELEKLLGIFHFIPDFPENYPYHQRYTFLLKLWDEEHVPLSFGNCHIEFCEYDEENCPFPGYCTSCKEYKEEIRNDEKKVKSQNEGENEIPF